jgi:uncharacterized protein YndB with AHSA1/START domain
MADILHRIGVEKASPQQVYDALTTVDGLSGWWTEQTSGKPSDIGGVIEFLFGPGGFDMEVTALDPGRHVGWKVVEGPEEWLGTTVRFDLRQDGDYTIVLFKHEGWRAPVEFMHHCSTKWAIYLMSLKQLVETGTGAPDPHDVSISNWR